MASKSSVLESKVYDFIDELADEFDLPVIPLPEVYWVGKNFSYDRIGLFGEDREDCKEKASSGKSMFIVSKNIIVIGEDSPVHICEEATHCVHFSNADLRSRYRRKEGFLALNSIIEMIGFFGSKLQSPSRKNIYRAYPDPLFDRKEYIKFEEKFCFDRENYFIYKNGYDMGEKLYDAYISSEISKEFIRELLLNDFSKKGSVDLMFSYLKLGVLNFENRLPTQTQVSR